jgi:hypothetical protein
MWKKAVVAYFNVISQYLRGETEKNHDTSVRIVDSRCEVATRVPHEARINQYCTVMFRNKLRPTKCEKPPTFLPLLLFWHQGVEWEGEISPVNMITSE